MPRKGSLDPEGAWPNPTHIVPELTAKVQDIHALPTERFYVKAKDDDKQAIPMRVPADLHELASILIAHPLTPYRYYGHFARDAMWHRAVQLTHVLDLGTHPAWVEQMKYHNTVAEIEMANHRAEQTRKLHELLDGLLNNLDEHGPRDMKELLPKLMYNISGLGEDRRPALLKKLTQIRAAMRGRGWLVESVPESPATDTVPDDE